MTIREARTKARSSASRQQIDRLVVVLVDLANDKKDRRCAVCGLVSPKNEAMFVIPVTYIARCLVSSNLVEYANVLPLRTGFLCFEHRDTFNALFIDPADPRWDVSRLEHRAEVLGGVMAGSLLVFGGEKGLKVAREFQAAIVALRESH